MPIINSNTYNLNYTWTLMYNFDISLSYNGYHWIIFFCPACTLLESFTMKHAINTINNICAPDFCTARNGFAGLKNVTLTYPFAPWTLIRITESGNFLLMESGIPLTIVIPNPSSSVQKSGFQWWNRGNHSVESKVRVCYGLLNIERDLTILSN